MTYLIRHQINRVQDAVVCLRCGREIGTDFFVLPGLIASCYHVVKSFESSDLKITWKQKTLKLKKIHIPENTSNPDLVLLEVDETEHPVLPIEPSNSANNEVYSFGFQYTERSYNGYPVWGKDGGILHENQASVSQDFLLIREANIQGGMSGAPLFSLTENRVIGVINRNNKDGGGYAIPIARIEELQQGLLEENKKLTINVNYSDESLVRYFAQVCAEHQYIRMVDLNREVKLEDIYVSLTIAPESLTGRRLTLDVAGRLADQIGEKITKIDVRRDLGSPQRRYVEREVTLQELISQQKVIILGDPGAGKTTLLRHLIARIGKGEIFMDKIPAFIKLSDLRKEPGCIKQYLKVSYDYVYNSLEQAIINGDIVFFIDGLDEISKEDYEIIEREINRLASNQNKIFLTCRIAAFPQGLFSSDYKIYECVGFNAPQQRRFLKGWFSNNSELAIRLERQLRFNRGTFGFAKNPLLLSLIAIVVENDPKFELPSSRLALYKRVLELLLNRRQRSKDILHLTERLKLELLKKISFYMFLQGKEIFTHSQILQFIDNFQDKIRDSLGIKVSSEDILDVLVEQDGVLAKSTESSFCFLHLTFQEYLTALFISEVDDWKVIVKQRILDPRWEEVLRLLAGILPSDQAEVLLKIIWNDQDKKPPIWQKLFFVNQDKKKDIWLTNRIFLAGRCASDSQNINLLYLNKLTSELCNYVFESDLDLHIDGATDSLASLCSSYQECLENVISWFNLKAQSELTFVLLVRYIQLLKLIASPDTLKELMILVDHFLSRIDHLDEIEIQIIGSLVEAIFSFGHGYAYQKLSILMDKGSSYLCTITALSLVNLPLKDIQNQLKQYLSSPLGLSYIPAAYTLFRYEEPEINKQLLQQAFSEKIDYFIQLLARQVLDMSSLEDIDRNFVINLFDNCDSEINKANLIGIFTLVGYINDPSFVERIIFEQNHQLVLRCAAIESFIYLYPNNIDILFYKLFDEFVDSEILRIAISTLSCVGNNSMHSFLCERIDHTSDYKVILSFLRLLILLPSTQTEDWLLKIIENFSESSNIYLYSLMALAEIDSQKSLRYTINFLKALSDNKIADKVFAYKLLANYSSEELLDFLIDQLNLETDILVITQIIESISKFKTIKAEKALLMCLTPSQWPSNWPHPQTPIKQGEQKPSDRRRLKAIIGLNQLLSINSIPILEHIAEDTQESVEIRDAADFSVRNISWNSGLLLHN